MYASETAEQCPELGITTGSLKPGRDTDPQTSKLGGSPVWFGDPPVPEDSLVCRLCGGPLLQVAQVYAPTQHPRSLCLLACNRAPCSVQTGGWRVLRTQRTDAGTGSSGGASRSNNLGVAASDAGPPADTAPETVPVHEEETALAAKGWGDPGEDWGAQGTGWGGGGDGDGGDDWGLGGAGGDGSAAAAAKADSIEALLSSHEDRHAAQLLGKASAAQPEAKPEAKPEEKRRGREGHSAKQEARHTSKGGRGGVANGGGGGRGVAFPCMALDFVPEPWEAFADDAGDDSDMERRLRRYREQEEDAGIVALLDDALQTGGGGGRARGVRSAQAAAAAAATSAPGEKYERTPAMAKAVIHFAQRVARLPEQAIRYAYGGQPLWSTPRPPDIGRVPKCPCGARRVFEMQLMPSVILSLGAERLAAELEDRDEQQSLRGATGPGPGPATRMAGAAAAAASIDLHPLPKVTGTEGSGFGRGGGSRDTEEAPERAGGEEATRKPPTAAAADADTTGAPMHADAEPELRGPGVLTRDSANQPKRRARPSPGPAMATLVVAETQTPQCDFRVGQSQGTDDSNDGDSDGRSTGGDGGGGGTAGQGDAGAGAVGAAAAPPLPTAEDRERVRARGMDWGVVAVWSCPQSCGESFEECVVIQPPE